MTKAKGKATSGVWAVASKAPGMRTIESGTFQRAGVAASVPAAGSGFLAKTRLKKAGGSLVMTVPASARNLLGLTEGQEMTVSVEGSKVIIEPVPAERSLRVRRPKYTLEQLLTDATPDVTPSEDEQIWHDDPPVGRETW